MIKQESYGIIPLKKKGSNWEVLIVKHSSGNYWGFPKGKKSGNETPQETAKRELREETCLTISAFIEGVIFSESYQFEQGSKSIEKKVSYFPAIVSGKAEAVEPEILEIAWIPLEEVEQHLSFEGAKSIIRKLLKAFKEKI